MTKGAVIEPRQVHDVDIGVSHGVRWTTLLEALTRVPWGSTPPSVRLTVVGPAATPPVPFSASPPGYDCSPQLLRYTKSIDSGGSGSGSALLHATAGRRRGSLPWTAQASTTSARRSSISPHLLLT